MEPKGLKCVVFDNNNVSRDSCLKNKSLIQVHVYYEYLKNLLEETNLLDELNLNPAYSSYNKENGTRYGE